MIKDAVKIVTNRRHSGSVKKNTWKGRVSLFLQKSLFKERPILSESTVEVKEQHIGLAMG